MIPRTTIFICFIFLCQLSAKDYNLGSGADVTLYNLALCDVLKEYGLVDSLCMTRHPINVVYENGHWFLIQMGIKTKLEIKEISQQAYCTEGQHWDKYCKKCINNGYHCYSDAGLIIEDAYVPSEEYVQYTKKKGKWGGLLGIAIVAGLFILLCAPK